MRASAWGNKQKVPNLSIEDLCLLSIVGMTRFELATTRPPDVYSNRAELHPVANFSGAKIIIIFQSVQLNNKKM